MRELTPEEETLLAEISQPAAQSPKFEVDEIFQRKLLSAMLQCSETAAEVVKFVKAEFFNNDAHMIAARLVLQYYKENSQQPTRWIMEQEFASAIADRDPEIKLHYRAELESVYDYFCAGLQENQYMVKTIREWAKRQQLKIAYTTITDNSKTPEEIITAMQIGIETAKTFDGATRVSDNWQDVQANMESEEWLIPNWLEFGSLGMLSGDPFSGKSHIIAEVIAAIVQHGKFTRYEVPKCAVLVVDAENKRRIFVKRLLGALGEGNQDSPNGLLRRVDTTRLELPMPVATAPETIRSLIKEAKLSTGQDRVFVVIDTLRSCLGADEMEAKEMKDLLYPLQRVAQEENAAILILHHRPKSGAAYSGQTSIAGALDFLWMWESDIETGIGKLSIKGTRGDYEQPLKFCLTNGKNNWIQDPDTGVVAMAKKRNSIEDMLDHILKDGARTQSDVVQQIQNLWTDGTVPGRDTIRDLLNNQVGQMLVLEKGPHNKSYYRLMASA